MKKILFWSNGSFVFRSDKYISIKKSSSICKIYKNIYIFTNNNYLFMLKAIFFIVPILFIVINEQKKEIKYFVIPSPVGLIFYFITLLFFIFSVIVYMYNIIFYGYFIKDIIKIVIFWAFSFLLFYFNPVLLSFYREEESRIISKAKDLINFTVT